MTAPDTAHPLAPTLAAAGRAGDFLRQLIIQADLMPGEEGVQLRRTLRRLGQELAQLRA